MENLIGNNLNHRFCGNVSNTNYIYPVDFFKNLSEQISKTLSRFINKHKSSKKFDLNIPFNKEIYLKLSHYERILQKIEKCQNCYPNITSEEIVQVVKNNLNRI